MKYVLLRHPTTHEQRIELGLAPRRHADLAAAAIAEGFQPATAGFVRMLDNGSLETFGSSDSLGVASHPDDSRILSALYRATLALAPAK